MKFEVLKDVMIDGVAYSKGAKIDINHDKTARLEMLGYIQQAKVTTNRAVGVEGSDEKPKTRRKKAD